ncbi:MAG: bifunctional folylpolyglutamate synthase/dihydrofolate synthase [Canibacter sp.]
MTDDSDQPVDPRLTDPWADAERGDEDATGVGRDDDAYEAEEESYSGEDEHTAAVPTGLSQDAMRGEVVEHMLQPIVGDDEENEEATLLERAEEEIESSVLAAESESAVERVYEELLTRVGEAHPRPRIDPVRRFAELAGQPQTQFPVIHVAGTNGKTSTSRAIESILRAHGLHTGLFTSPHLVNFNERIQLDGEPIDGTVLEAAWKNLQPALQIVDSELITAGQGKITFFEALAILAFEAFADAPVDVAVIEVGMGGEWDATNIVTSDVAVFTPVAMDHTEILGSTISDIAGTKAGIINDDSIVVSAEQDAAAKREIQRVSREHNAPVHFVGEDIRLIHDPVAVGGRLITVAGLTNHTYDATLLPLFGRHQALNASLAIAAVEAFFGGEREIPQEIIEHGLAQLTAPGRLQLLAQDPAVYVDAAHNPHGARSLAATVEESFEFAELALIVGILEEKDAAGVLRELAPLATRLTLTPVRSPRSLSPEQLEELAHAVGTNVTVAQSLEDALDDARDWASATESRGVLVAGSVVLAGEAIAVAHAEGWSV